MRHKMLNITYDWDNEQARINYSSHFNAYDPLEMMDSLQDVICMLEQRYEEARQDFRLDFEERNRRRIKKRKNDEQD